MRRALVIGILLAIGCRESSKPPPQHATRPETEDSASSVSSSNVADVREESSEPGPPPAWGPVSLRVAQRSTSPFPLPDEHVLLTVDDVTGGQVMTSLSLKDGTLLHAPVSLQPGDELIFKANGRSFQLQLVQLHNQLVGEDAAEFLINPRQETSHVRQEPSRSPSEAKGPPRLTEAEKIERLIQAVEQQSGAVFVRNGREHSSAEAAEHLRRKWNAAGDRVTTAEQFIEHIASRSSLSGRAYAIRWPDGTETPSAEFLRNELRKLQSTPEK